MSFEDLFVAELLEYSLILDASVLGHEVDDRVEDAKPGLVLGLGVGNQRDRVSIFVSECNLRDDLSTGTIFLVRETRVIHVKVRLVLGHQVVATVELRSVTREPRVFDADGIVSQQCHAPQ